LNNHVADSGVRTPFDHRAESSNDMLSTMLLIVLILSLVFPDRGVNLGYNWRHAKDSK
jgi:hypothetical protein